MDGFPENFAEQVAVVETGNLNYLKQENTCDLGPEDGEKRWPGWPGESVFRILVPAHKVGGLIGRKGEFIKKIQEESRARIKILDAPKGLPERAVIISAKDEPDISLPPAIDGLLRVHKRISDGLDAESAHPPLNAGNSVPTRLLVPASQAGNLIGKHGTTIKSIQDASKCIVRIIENLPPIALPDDKVVEIQGEPGGMHKAVELIGSHLRKFLVDRSVVNLFEKPVAIPNMHMEHNMAPPQPWGPPPGIPPNAGLPGYGVNPHFMPPMSHDNFYPSPDLPPMENQPHHGISMYGQNAPLIGVHSSANQQPPPMVSQLTNYMQIPLSYADAVIGAAGANISYIRRASGATITIQESRAAPDEMTVEVAGSATQVQTAQQLIQNFMAEAAASAPTSAPVPVPVPVPVPASAPVQAQNSLGLADQGYNSYISHEQLYGSLPENTGSAALTAGGYGAAYETNYGY